TPGAWHRSAGHIPTPPLQTAHADHLKIWHRVKDSCPGFYSISLQDEAHRRARRKHGWNQYRLPEPADSCTHPGGDCRGGVTAAPMAIRMSGEEVATREAPCRSRRPRPTQYTGMTSA